MFETVTPESVGISSKQVTKLISIFEKRFLSTHSILMMRGDKIFAENYWAPFDKAFLHRMYSQTKSFVAVAIGLLEEEGKLSLDDKIAKYFKDKIDGELPYYLEMQTIRDMLTMTTSGNSEYWFTSDDCDRAHIYFNRNKITHPSGTSWEYDSAGSQVLSILVERLSGMTMLDYLKTKIFNHIGTFQTAAILKTPTGESWGDSAMLCTTRDMASFGRFVMNYGTWGSKRLMNEDFLRKSTSRLVENEDTGHYSSTGHGYGYQIWRFEQNSFGFVGMGDQLTICVPDKDFLFTCTSDNQGAPWKRQILFNAVFDEIVNCLSDSPVKEDPVAYSELNAIGSKLKLRCITGEPFSLLAKEIDGKTYTAAGSNPQKITHFSLHFKDNNSGEFRYTNAQGDKILPFGINHNIFDKFPQYGYSDEYGGVRTTNGHLYNCAVSASWRTDCQFAIYVQIIDRYFGNLMINFSFKGEEVHVTMKKTAEDFLNEYQGDFVASRLIK